MAEKQLMESAGKDLKAELERLRKDHQNELDRLKQLTKIKFYNYFTIYLIFTENTKINWNN